MSFSSAPEFEDHCAEIALQRIRVLMSQNFHDPHSPDLDLLLKQARSIFSNCEAQWPICCRVVETISWDSLQRYSSLTVECGVLFLMSYFWLFWMCTGYVNLGDGSIPSPSGFWIDGRCGLSRKESWWNVCHRHPWFPWTPGMQFALDSYLHWMSCRSLTIFFDFLRWLNLNFQW